MEPSRARLGPLLLLVAAVAGACSSPDPETGGAGVSTPTPEASADHSVLPPVLYFNLTEEDALTYLEELDHRIQEAIHHGDLGALHDIYTHDGPAGLEAADTIIRQFRRGLVDSTDIEVVSTEVLRITSQLAVFRQVRLVRPCVYTFGAQQDVTPDHRVMRQTVIRHMADERLNWRIHREVIERSVPTGERVTACP
jgi:hypothetical protein